MRDEGRTTEKVFGTERERWRKLQKERETEIYNTFIYIEVFKPGGTKCFTFKKCRNKMKRMSIIFLTKKNI